ncbi:MAG TPA: GNAT family N-acetyltransferase [Pseudonocardia sp.]|nr:GNAT family N-acetyltransferase [Pseudonocardia sp.]
MKRDMLQKLAVPDALDVAVDPALLDVAEVSVELCARPAESVLATWDHLVAGAKDSDITQLSGWATVRHTAGYEPLYVFARQAGELVGGALVLVKRIPVLGRIGYVAYGPVIAAAAPRGVVVTKLCDALLALARTRLRALFVQPFEGADISAALLERGFRDSTAGVAPPATIRIDLSATEEELRAGLSKRIRRWTGKWAKSGVTVRRGGVADLEVLADLLRRTAEHQGFSELSPDYVRTLYAQFADSGLVDIFVGEVEGTPVAAELFTTCGGVLRCRLTGMDRSSPAVRLSVTSALDWEAMKWAKANGFAEFDLGGLSAGTAALVAEEGFSCTELDGAARFKVGFGGRLHHYPRAVELISSPILRKAYDKLGSGSVGEAMVDRARQWMRHGARAVPK